MGASMKNVRERVLKRLTEAYCAEIETICNYIANSVHLDGVRAEEIKKSLAADVTEELAHAQMLAERLKQIHGKVPGSLSLKFNQKEMQPPRRTTDVISVIRGVIAAEKKAIKSYRELIEMTDGDDYVTQDLCTQLLKDEEKHLTQFVGFLKEYEE